MPIMGIFYVLLFSLWQKVNRGPLFTGPGILILVPAPGLILSLFATQQPFPEGDI